MKITCTRENLKRALLLTSKIVGNASTLPILNNVLLKTETGQLLLSSTNLEIAVKTRVGGQIDEIGEITVPAKTLTDYISNLSEEKIILQTKNTDLIVKTSKTESLLKGLPAEEFPLIPEVKPLATISLNAELLAEGLGQVVFATAYSETQPELSGVLFRFEEGVLYIAATDRYRLAERKIAISRGKVNTKIIIPGRAVNELVRVLAEAEGEVDVLVAESQVLFRTNNTEFISRVIEGQYPDYQQIIPKSFSTEVTMKSSELSSALKLSSLFVQDNNNVELKIKKTPPIIILQATSQKYGSNTVQVSGDVIGEDNQIIFNYRYILDCLNHISQDQIVLKMIDSASPAMIVPTGESQYLYLVMPIKT